MQIPGANVTDTVRQKDLLALQETVITKSLVEFLRANDSAKEPHIRAATKRIEALRQQGFENFGDEAFRTNLSHLHNVLLPEAADEDTVRKSRDALVMNKHHPFAKSLT